VIDPIHTGARHPVGYDRAGDIGSLRKERVPGMSDAQRIDEDGLDPDIRRFVTAVQRGYGEYRGFDALPLPERRRAAEAVRAPWRAGGPGMWRSADIRIGAVRGRVHIPVEAPLGALLYLHGGGWTMFSIDTHDRLMREYARRSGAIVVGIDYSLSPEAKFPTALNDVLAAIDWLRGEGGGYGIDPARLAAGGDSAGANLAVAAALRLRELGLPQLKALLLNYGAFSAEPTASYERYGGPRYMLTVDEMQDFWNNYTASPAELGNPLVAPYRADLRGLSPAFFCIAACDILADSNRAMAARFAAARVPCEVHVYPGATHSFLEAVSIAPLAERALEEGARWLRARLAAG
jgi:acetyl esterase